MEEEKIEVIKKQPKPKSVRDILIFLGFANFYKRFIKNFNKIIAPLISMLQITNKSTSNGLQYSIQAESQNAPSAIGRPDRGKIDDRIENLSSSTKVKKNFEIEFLTFGVKKAFIRLRNDFTKALILKYFDLECHI